MNTQALPYCKVTVQMLHSAARSSKLPDLIQASKPFKKFTN